MAYHRYLKGDGQWVNSEIELERFQGETMYEKTDVSSVFPTLVNLTPFCNGFVSENIPSLKQIPPT